MNYLQHQRAFVGTEKKIRIEIEGEGFDMVTDNFDVILRCGEVEKLFHKEDLIENTVIEDEQEKHEFILCYNTADFGPGQLVCIVKAYVPDTDFPDGFRTEIDKFNLIPIDPL